MPPTALIPLRAPGAGKSRLAPGLSREERAALAGAMLADVAAALQAAGLEPIVAAAGTEAVAAAAALGLDAVMDQEGAGLDRALADAHHAIGAPRDLLVVMADLPTLSGSDVEVLLARGPAVVVAPTDDGGTGALLRRPANSIPTAYGPDSAARHIALARSAGVEPAEVDRPGFRLDVDTRADLLHLVERRLGVATAAFLRNSGIADRLRDTG